MVNEATDGEAGECLFQRVRRRSGAAAPVIVVVAGLSTRLKYTTWVPTYEDLLEHARTQSRSTE